MVREQVDKLDRKLRCNALFVLFFVLVLSPPRRTVFVLDQSIRYRMLSLNQPPQKEET